MSEFGPPALDQRREETERIANQLVALARRTRSIRAVAMVGSWARGEPRPDSDLDIIILGDDGLSPTIAHDWLRQLGATTALRERQWGVVTEHRGRMSSGLEVELGVGPLSWADTAPIDPGTLCVASEGLKILFDLDGRLAELERAVRDRASEEPVLVVPYDQEWPARFLQEKELLESAIGQWITGGVHHVGSTAVPGLDAKPVIDILVGVESLYASRRCFDLLAELGYLYAPYRAEEMHWFCKPSRSHRTHHLHLVPTGSERYEDELALRNVLRARPDVAAQYVELKHELADVHRDDREAYTAGKAEFIEQALRHREPTDDQ